MKKNFFIYFFIFASIVTCYSQGLKVLSFEEDDRNFKGTINPVQDINGENCSVIKIAHDIEGDIFIAEDKAYKREVDTKQIVYFWISRWEKNIEIVAPNYLPYKYSFPLTLTTGKTYTLILQGNPEEVDVYDIPVKIDTYPQGATVYIDNVKISSLTPFSEFFDSGFYPLKIELENYLTYNSYIRIGASGVDTTFVLEPNFGTMIIKSKPEVNMFVSLNNQEVGQTPLILPMLPAGNYELKSYNDFYQGKEKTFFLESADTLVIELEPTSDYGTLTINTDNESEIYLNDKKISDYENIILSPQTVTIKAFKKKHHDTVERIILRKGEFHEIDIFPKLIGGDVLVNPQPDSVKVELFGKDGEYFHNIGISKFSNIPHGEYNLVLTCNQFLPYQEKFRLMENDRLRFDYELTKASYNFTLDFPAELTQEVDILVFDPNNIQIPYSTDDNHTFYLEHPGIYNLSLQTSNRIIYSKILNIDTDKSPRLNLRYMKFIAPSPESKIYLNKKNLNLDSELITASEIDQKIIVKIETPRATDFNFAKVSKESDKLFIIKKLVKNIDYREFTNHYGIALASGDKKVFYGIKLPLIHSPYYQEFNGIEVNLFSGNFGPSAGIYKFEGGVFNGMNISLIGGSVQGNMNGVSLASFANITDNNHRGLQISLINYAKILKGIQIGLINITGKESKSFRFSPVINLGF